jgi:hypothetical protein
MRKIGRVCLYWPPGSTLPASGRVVDPDSETLWIRIRIGNPDPGARKLINFSGNNALISYLKKILLLKSYNIALLFEKNLDELLTQILISKKF